MADKERAFAEFFRVLRPGGRLSIFEPINRFGIDERRRTAFGFEDVRGVEDLVARVIAEIDRAQGAAGGLGPMVAFDERDLLQLAEQAGFVDLRLTFTAEVTREPMWHTRDWDVLLDSSPNPLAPTLREAIAAALDAAEARRLEEVLRPQVEQGRGTTRNAHAFLVGRKP